MYISNGVTAKLVPTGDPGGNLRRPGQLIVLGKGALRVPASAFRKEVDQCIGEVRGFLERLQLENQGSYAIWEKVKTDC